MNKEELKECIRPDYEKIMKDMEDKHKEEVEYLKNRVDELLKENEVLKLKWSVVELIFN